MYHVILISNNETCFIFVSHKYLSGSCFKSYGYLRGLRIMRFLNYIAKKTKPTPILKYLLCPRIPKFEFCHNFCYMIDSSECLYAVFLKNVKNILYSFSEPLTFSI